MGYVQYDSFLEDEWKHCGWAAGPVGAAHAFKHGCARARRPYGPFPFVVGAMTAMGADLASWMRRWPHMPMPLTWSHCMQPPRGTRARACMLVMATDMPLSPLLFPLLLSSPMIAQLVQSGRASQAEPTHHWDCGYSDVTLGYALARSNLSISLVSIRDAMRDATYGAMAAKRFVVSHHLRKRQQFVSAHAEARAAREWVPQPQPCMAWPDVASSATLKLKEGDRRELHDGMRAFSCCQKWRVCEIGPQE
jgi:hypothetical protein